MKDLTPSLLLGALFALLALTAFPRNIERLGVVAGLGNIYVCEALFRAGVSPRRLAVNVSARRAERLVETIRAVLGEAIAAGGSSLRDYVQASGELGYFQHNFRVYGREGEACASGADGHVVRRLTQSGRSTFYCPACQR